MSDEIGHIQAELMCSQEQTLGSVDTRNSSQNTFWPSWDSVSTLVQVVSTQCFKCKAKQSSNVDTVQVVSTLETAPRTPSGQAGTVCRH
ncbi:hypothetical protein Taro_016403 [Colocasia esculenta]|uniref:Uncharacterized protein n=1 Tax=Colocasia esculenta TaxID=4460 RepID=A0A843USU0_COLES|nr:hypothetical protein [Colocasia esculenta]